VTAQTESVVVAPAKTSTRVARPLARARMLSKRVAIPRCPSAKRGAAGRRTGGLSSIGAVDLALASDDAGGAGCALGGVECTARSGRVLPALPVGAAGAFVAGAVGAAAAQAPGAQAAAPAAAPPAAAGAAVRSQAAPAPTSTEPGDQVAAATTVRALPTQAPTSTPPAQSPTPFANAAATPQQTDPAAPLRIAAALVGVLAAFGILIALLIRHRLQTASPSHLE